MLVETSLISTAYPDWGVFEGVRELFQNMRDGHLEGYDMSIDVTSNTTIFMNSSVSLPREALLIGYTTKTGKENQAGRFGEGLKLGSLVLARAGRSVAIRFGTEIWTPKIAKSKIYNTEVLAVEIKEGLRDCKELRVTIDLSKKEWNDLKHNFLPAVEYNAFKCDHGEILTEPKYKGMIYAKDIFVQEVEKLEYGYNLYKVKTDRDRRMIDEWDMKGAIRKIWGVACEEDPSFYRAFWNMLADDKRDMGFFRYSSSGISDQIASQIIADFQSEHGENAYPVLHESEAKDLSHLGGKGIVVSCGALVQIAERAVGDIDEIKQKLASSVERRYRHEELEAIEKINLFKAAALLAKTLDDPGLRSRIEIVDFNSQKTLGQYRGGRYLIARRVLSDLSETRKVLIHEIAHGYGRDGEKSHVHGIESIWAKLFDYKTRR